MRSLTLRSNFILVLAFGAVLPLGVMGYWLARSTQRSGEQLLQARLAASLEELANEINRSWVNHRSHLLDIAEHEAIVRALRGSDLPDGGDADLNALYARYGDDILSVTVRDRRGAERARLDSELRPGTADWPEIGPVLPVRLDIYSPDGERSGVLEARVRWASILPSGAEWASTPGSVLAVFERETGLAIRASTMDAEVLRQPRFEWDGEPWLSGRRVVREPSLELLLAAPLGPLTQPFSDATKRGVLALVAVGLGSLLLTTLVTTRITGSLSRLAAASDAVAAGNLEQKVPEDGSAELVRVATAFNAMTDNLRETLRQLSQQQSLAAVGEFAASLAHEVRNPLSSIRVDLQLAAEELDGGRAGELVARAFRSIERLNETVTGALRVARSGRIEPRRLDLLAVLDAAIHCAEPELEARSVTLDRQFGSGDPLQLSGDPAALEQVFLNLLLNATHAAPEGGTVRVRVLPEGDAVQVWISDNGDGIPPGVREHVLEPFYSTREHGSGLGLPITQRIVSAHGGTLTIETRMGTGTSVQVRLPRGSFDRSTRGDARTDRKKAVGQA